MEDKNNGLIVVTKSIFDKIKNFFKNIFGKKVIEESSSEPFNEINDNILESSQEDVEKVTEADSIQDKKEFFKKYKEYKEGKINAEDFIGSEKVKLYLMLEEELNINTRKLEQI